MEIKTLTSGRLENNTYIVTKNKDCVIIDASCSLSDLKQEVKDKNVLAVFLTHGHYDHFKNLEEIVREFNIKCFLTEKEYERLLNPKTNYSIIFGLFKVCRLPKDFFIFLKSKDQVVLNDFLINTFVTKGHTDGGICIEIDKNIFTGDTKFFQNSGRTDLISGSEKDMKESLEFLQLNFKGCPFYPGHGKGGKI